MTTTTDLSTSTVPATLAELDDDALARIYRVSMLTDSLRDSARELLTSGGWGKEMVGRMAERYRLLRAQASQYLPGPDRDEVVVWTPALEDDADPLRLNIESIFEAAAALAAYIDTVVSTPVWVVNQRMMAAQVERARNGDYPGALPEASTPSKGSGQGQYL